MPRRGRNAPGKGEAAGAGEAHEEEFLEGVCFYECLSVERDASGEQIKRSFMRLAKKWHPDRNKAPEAKLRFQQISTAYEVLSDDETRRLYDSYGADVALGKKPEPGMGPFGIRRGQQQQRQGEDCEVSVVVTLTELFLGTSKTVSFSRSARCRGCDGKGAKGRVRKEHCRPCRGMGFVSRMHVVGGMFMQRVDSPCDDCDAKGWKPHPDDACHACGGTGTKIEAAKVKVPISCGLRPGDDVVRVGQEGHAGKNCVPGDLVVHLEMEEEEAEMKRIGSNLVLTKDITLIESLLGFTMVITHLDGRKIVVKTDPGEMVKAGEFRVIKDEGMPTGGNATKRGDLIVLFSVEYPSPEEMTESAIGHLLLALPSPTPRLAPKEAVEVHMDPYSREEFDHIFEGDDFDDDEGDYDYDSEEEYYDSGPSCTHQ